MTRHAKHKPSKGSSSSSSSSATATAMASPLPRSLAASAFATVDSDDQQDAPLLVLHVIRILALYLYVLLSQHGDALNLREIFFPETTQTQTQTQLLTASSIEQQVHAALLACVQGEIASNQFDGLIQEKTVFAAMKRVFRQQKIKAATQCQLLLRLLNSYLTQLNNAPIVHCESVGMLASTLEYLSGNCTQKPTETVSISLLYPLVNAIDSLSIEQRECLDALTTLWRWLGECDPTGKILDRIVSLQHSVIFELKPTEPTKASTSSSVSAAELGACFIRTLIRHADHIFRHDLDFTSPQDLLNSDSDTEDMDDSPTLLPLLSVPSTPPSTKRSKAPHVSPSVHKKQQQKRKTGPATIKMVASPEEEADPVSACDVIDANEPMPASMMRVGIAAAAGTLAAALCVIFT